MRVLVCIPCLLTGGTEIQTLSLVKALRTAGHDVCVACYFEYSPGMVEQYENAGAQVRLLSADGKRPGGIRATTSHLYKGLKSAVKEFQPDVAHVQYMAPGAIPIFILRWLGVKKIIATAHTGGDIYSPRGLKLVRWINNRLLTAFQCITERAERSFFGSSSLFSETSQLKQHKHGNHFTIYNNLPSYISIRETAKEFDDSQPVTIGVVSRLEPIKGMDLVVKAFDEVHRVYPNTKLLVVGDGSLRGSMESEVKDAVLEDSVEFAGRQPQNMLESYYDRIEILLMPSRSEGFGLTAVEGMARGCVPVVSDTGGLPEVVRNGIDGLLHRKEDVKDMAAKICSVIEDREMKKRLTEGACRRAAVFSTERYNGLIDELYRGVQKGF